MYIHILISVCMYNVHMHICIHVFVQLRTEKVIHPVELASREIGLSGTTFGFRNEIIPQFLAESWQGFLCSFIKPSTYICIYINICITLPNLPTHTHAHSTQTRRHHNISINNGKYDKVTSLLVGWSVGLS